MVVRRKNGSGISKSSRKDLFKKDEVESKVNESLDTATNDNDADMGLAGLFEEAESEISEKVKITFKDTKGSNVNGVTVKITPNELQVLQERLH